MEEVRRHIQSIEDRRKYPRLPVDFPVMVFPVTGDGVVFPAIAGKCRDISRGGIRFVAEASVATGYAFVGFGGVPETEGWCLLTRLLRNRDLPRGYEYGGRYRTDLI
jgi:hypothetical protein